MSLRIWETDPESKPQPRNRFADDVVGYIHGGMMTKKAPVALSEWRFTTDDPDVAARLAALFGGSAEEWDTEKSNNLQVLSETSELRLIVDNPEALRARMVLWGRKGPIHTCDGMYHLDGENKGQPCGCPAEFAVRKAEADKGTGPQPEITLKARLAADPELGYLLYRTGSWQLTKELHQVEDEIAEAAHHGSRILASLRLDHVEFDNKKGQHVEYYRPVITDIAAEITESLTTAA